MKRILIFISLGSWLALSIAFAAYLVLNQFQPEAELRRMLVAMSQVTTVDESAALSWTRAETDTGRVTTTVFAKGQLRMTPPGLLEYGVRFRAVRVEEAGEDSELSGEVRRLEDQTYLTYAPPGPTVPGLLFGEETWLVLSDQDLRLWGPLIPGLEIPLIANDLPSSAWTDESIETLRQNLGYADVFHVLNAELTEIVDGVATRVFDVRIDPDAAKSFLRGVVRVREGRELTDNEWIQIEEQGDALARLTVRLWIGVDDHRLYRLQAAGAVDEAGSGTDLTPVDVLIHFENYDAPFTVEAPSEAIALAAFAQAFGVALPEAGEAAFGSRESTSLLGSTEARLPVIQSETVSSDDPDADGLSNLLEGFYGSNPTVADTDGDGVSDGAEVLDGRNPRGGGSLFGFGLPEPPR